MLRGAAKRLLPGLDDAEATRWCGHRPSTPDSLPVLGSLRQGSAVSCAFGHGHLGLTLAATTGRLVADMLRDRPTWIDPAPMAPGRWGK